jgi:hypothetical protein
MEIVEDSKMKKLSLIVIVGVSILCAGCFSFSPTFKIPETNPQPNINLPVNDGKTSLSLVIDKSIMDTFDVKGAGYTISVSGYRESLENGFKNGFQDFYKIAASNSNSDLTINLERADFNPTARSLIITYKAALIKNGEIIKRTADRVEQISGKDPTDTTKLDIEKMYEAIAKDLFQ